MSTKPAATGEHERAGARQPHRGGRRVLAVCSAGGHLKQLSMLVGRIPDVEEVTWLTHDSGLTMDVLRAAGRADDEVIFAPYAAPRDVKNLARASKVAWGVLRREHYDLAVSTGAGIAVAALPLARILGVRSCFIESATRADHPSMTGRILQRTPGIELCTQNRRYSARWRSRGSVHDGFQAGPARDVGTVQRVVVTLGTIRPYGFARLVRRLVRVLPEQAEVVWQTGVTDVAEFGIEGRETVPTAELEMAMRDADVVIAHAGTGSALSAFEMGRCPILVPRRASYHEHIDDHQVETARALAARGLARYVEVEELRHEHLLDAARRTTVRNHQPPAIDL